LEKDLLIKQSQILRLEVFKSDESIMGMKWLFKNRYLFLMIIGSWVVISDRFTKKLITDKFALGESKTIIPDFFDLTYVQNKGAAFGFLARTDPSFRDPFFIIVPCLALVGVFYIFLKIPDRAHLVITSMSLIISGAIGNLLDRLEFGYVVDFLYFHCYSAYYPAFNIADSAICIGVFLSVWDTFLEKKRNSEKTT
jgi:signal peptidase II